MSIVERTREWFLLRELEAQVARVSSDERAAASRAFALSDQRRRAAAIAWVGGVPAEAMRLASESLQLAAEATGADVERVEVPVFDEDVTAADAERYQGMLDAQQRLVTAHEALRLDVAAVRRRRLGHGLGVALALGATLGAAYVALRTPPHLEASAATRFDARFEPSNAVDGNEKTDWLLPDHATGTLDVKVVPARTVKLVKVLNARNLPFNDRAAKQVLVEALHHGNVVKSGGVLFDAQSADAVWRTLDVGAKIDAVRVTVQSSHGLGGGIAEVVVE